MPAKPPKPPIRIKWYVWTEGAKYYLYTSGDEQDCVENYVRRILYPKESCYVYIMENDETRRVAFYYVEVTTNGATSTYNITKYTGEVSNG